MKIPGFQKTLTSQNLTNNSQRASKKRRMNIHLRIFKPKYFKPIRMSGAALKCTGSCKERHPVQTKSRFTLISAMIFIRRSSSFFNSSSELANSSAKENYTNHWLFSSIEKHGPVFNIDLFHMC